MKIRIRVGKRNAGILLLLSAVAVISSLANVSVHAVDTSQGWHPAEQIRSGKIDGDLGITGNLIVGAGGSANLYAALITGKSKTSDAWGFLHLQEYTGQGVQIGKPGIPSDLLAHHLGIWKEPASGESLAVYGNISVAGDIKPSDQGSLLTGMLAYTDEYVWQEGDPPVKMVNSNDGFCFLTGVEGDFFSPSEWVEIYLETDNFWYLRGGSSGGRGVKAWARCAGRV
jgi:hypothetical protein